MKQEYYIAHPFNAREKIRKWQLKFQKANVDIKLTNPFYSKYRNDLEQWKDHKESSDILYKKLDPQGIVERDVELIKRQKTGIIAFITGDISYGTIQEMVYAKFHNKEVYSVITNGHHNHPWLQFHSDKVFQDINKLEKFLINRK